VSTNNKLYVPIEFSMNKNNFSELPENTIGEKLYKYRKEHDLFQKDVAKMLDVCTDTITGYEKERTIPTKKVKTKMKEIGII